MCRYFNHFRTELVPRGCEVRGKNNFSRSAVYHISGDREAWLRPFYRTFTNRFVEEKKNNKVRTITELVTISRNHRDLTKLQWLQTMSVLRKILPAFSTKDHNSCFATPRPPAAFPDIFLSHSSPVQWKVFKLWRFPALTRHLTSHHRL